MNDHLYFCHGRGEIISPLEAFNFMRKFHYVFFLLAIFESVNAQTNVSLFTGRNEGEHIFETGNKYANLSGIRGGSRITYPRNFNYLGLELSRISNKFLLSGKVSSTGGYVQAGEARDEDFFLRANSTESGTKIATREWSFHDSAYVFTGTQNFADGKGRSVVSEYKFEPTVRYYAGDASPDLWKSSNGFFFSFGLKYSYFKYYIYDVIQFVATNPITYSPIGKGLSYSNAVVEIPFGFGYKVSKDKLTLELSFDLLWGIDKFRDLHYWRALNFKGYSGGPGFQYKADFFYKALEDTIVKFSHSGHRLFQTGNFTTSGGNSFSDVLSNYAGKYSHYLNTKEVAFELSVIRNISQTK